MTRVWIDESGEAGVLILRAHAGTSGDGIARMRAMERAVLRDDAPGPVRAEAVLRLDDAVHRLWVESPQSAGVMTTPSSAARHRAALVAQLDPMRAARILWAEAARSTSSANGRMRVLRYEIGDSTRTHWRCVRMWLDEADSRARSGMTDTASVDSDDAYVRGRFPLYYANPVDAVGAAGRSHGYATLRRIVNYAVTLTESDLACPRSDVVAATLRLPMALARDVWNAVCDAMYVCQHRLFVSPAQIGALCMQYPSLAGDVQEAA